MDFNLNENEQEDIIEADTKIRADWRRLTEKQQLVIQRYLKTGNKLKSYRDAHYPDGILTATEKTVQRNCYIFFKKPHIAAVIAQIERRAVMGAKIHFDEIVDENIDDLIETQKQIHDLQIDAMWVLRRAALLANFNINSFIRVEGGKAVYDFTTATEDDWYCISEYTTETSTPKEGDNIIPVDKIKLKSFDKLRALELVGKHVDVAAFKDRLEHSGDDKNPIAHIIRGDDANL